MTSEVEELAEQVRLGSRSAVARAITLVESRNADHRADALLLLDLLTRAPGEAVRVAVSGLPGAGKSSLIEALGSMLTAQGHRIAVLAIDPSSTVTGGSVLGDRTRMIRLANDPNAFVRPSPSGGALGGVADATRAAITVVEAAGYDVVLVESVGVGQSEVAAADLVDCYCLVLLAGGGDQLQAIKRGATERADVIIVNKADGTGSQNAVALQRDLISAMRMTGAATPVLVTSAAEGRGIAEWWETVEKLVAGARGSGEFLVRRRDQRVRWTRSLVREHVLRRLHDPRTTGAVRRLESDVESGALTPWRAAVEVIAVLDGLGEDRARRDVDRRG